MPIPLPPDDAEPYTWTQPIRDVIAAGNALELAAGSYGDAVARALAKVGFIFMDSLTRPDALLSASNVSDTGHLWEVPSGAPTITSRKITSTAAFVALVDVGRANYVLRVKVVPQAGTAASVIVRSAAGTTDRLAVALDFTNGFRINKVDAGATIVLKTVAFTFVAGTEYEIWAVCENENITAYIDGVRLLEYDLTVDEVAKYEDFTRIGLRNNTSVVGVTFDEITVETLRPLGPSSTVPAGYALVYVATTGDDANLAAALASAPAEATLISVDVAGT